jgi:hypothetical protein
MGIRTHTARKAYVVCFVSRLKIKRTEYVLKKNLRESEGFFILDDLLSLNTTFLNMQMQCCYGNRFRVLYFCEDLDFAAAFLE